MRRLVTALALALVAVRVPAVPVGSAFTYQGRLADGGNPANGPYDLRFTLFDALAGGAPVGSPVTVEDVAVAEGFFTVPLDFGAGAFRGDARFLEVAARPGASTGAFTTIGGRQELRPSPNALWSAAAADVPWTGVSGKPAGFADNVDDDSGGTVTTVATGAGLTGGPITGSGTVSVATGGIVSNMVADGAIGLSQIDTAQVQARIGGVCPLGSYLRGINPDGSVVCTGLPDPHAVTTLYGPSSFVSAFLGMAIAPDGRPVISFYSDVNGGRLLFAKCANAACTTASAWQVLDDAGPNGVGSYSAIAIGSDGLPVVSYSDDTLGTLKVAKCMDASCASGTILTTVDDHPVNSVGTFPSIAVGTDGFPVISYRDETAGGLKVAKCVNLNCTGLNVITTVDNPANDVGWDTWIGIGTDGLPVIRHRDGTADTLKVVKCASAGCNTGATITTVATNVGVGPGRLAMPADGRPIISYETLASPERIRVVKCGNAACSSGNVDHEVYPLGLGGVSSIAIGGDGLPVVSYNAPGLGLTKCGDAACSSGNVLSILDRPIVSTNVAVGNAIARGADGLPIVVYTDLFSLKVAKCGNAACN
jgi:hypothetical protein